MPAVDWKAAKAVTDVVVPVVTVAGLFAGGFYTLYQYTQQQHDRRVAATMEYVSRYLTAPISDHRATLSRAWVKHEADLLTAIKGVKDAQAAAAAYRAAFDRMASDEDLALPMEEQLLFFEQLAQCVKLKLCEHDVADSMLAAQAREFYDNYHPYICTVRTTWNDPSTGVALQEFVQGRPLTC